MIVDEAKSHAESELRFKVDGMMCAGCASNVQRAIEGNAGVSTVSVSFANGLAVVGGDGVDSTEIIRSIESRGFVAREVDPGSDPAELRSSIEEQQLATERAWRFRAIVGLSIWAPLEALHWLASPLHWHGVGMDIVMLLGSTVVIATAGMGFYRSAWRAARRGTTNMDTLISMGATTAYVFSFIVFVAQRFGALESQPLYFAESAALLGIISLGHWLEARASAKAGSAVRELLELQPETAEKLAPDGSTETISSGDVEPGDRLVVRPGGRVPIDGIVIEGASEIDEAVVTGESEPVAKGPGDEVVAGSINTTGRLVIEASVDGRHTTISRIAELVQRAQSSKADVQKLADKVSSIFVPTVITIAAITVLGWWLAGELPKGIISAVTVLIISCPCALGLATPMAVMVGTGASSRFGILIKSAQAMERAGRTNRIIFDKTGTLTIGRPQLQSIEPADGTTEDEVLTLAAAVEMPSEHPIAQGIVQAAEQRGLTIPHVDDFLAIPGQGVSGRVDGRAVEVLRDERASCRVIVDGKIIGRMTLADQVRPDAAEAIRRLHAMDLRVTMLTGDRQHVAEQIGRTLGLASDEILAEMTPEKKAEVLSKAGRGSVMVGDGINDAAALASAGVGIALAGGTNIAIESADIVIPSDRVTAVPETIHIARKTLRTIKQNLFFAFFYNVCAIPAAAFGLLGVYGPYIAAGAMASSDITVIGNALRMRANLQRRHRRMASK